MADAEGGAKPDYERLKIAVDVWKHGVAVQMHFNDIEMRIRNLYFTILAASIGLIGAVVGKHIQVPYFSMEVSIAVFVIAAIVPMSMMFYFMDRHWYHRLLQGAVAQCAEIEKAYAAQLPEIQLGAKISQQSPVEFPHRFWKWLFVFVRDPRFRQHSRLHSDQKIEVLYKSVMWGAALLATAYALIGGVQIQKCALLPYELNLSCGIRAMAVAPTAEPQSATTPAAPSQAALPPARPAAGAGAAGHPAALCGVAGGVTTFGPDVCNKIGEGKPTRDLRLNRERRTRLMFTSKRAPRAELRGAQSTIMSSKIMRTRCSPPSERSTKRSLGRSVRGTPLWSRASDTSMIRRSPITGGRPEAVPADSAKRREGAKGTQ